MKLHSRALFLILFLFSLPNVRIAAADKASQRPNFLFVLVDDQSPFDFGFYNLNSTLKTPTIDSLAAKGMVIDQAYHMGSFSGAVCTPSRHMIMTGRTLWHLPNSPRGKETCPPEIAQQTLPAIFHRAGYATMRTCKRGNSYEAANKLFAIRRDASKRGGDDETGSAWHAQQVLDYLDERVEAKDDRPFFIYYGFSHPHDTRDGKPEYLAKYGATNHTDPENPPPRHPRQPPLPKNYLTKHPFDNSHADVRDEVAVSGVWIHRDEASIRNEIGRQYACSENIDFQIQRVLDKLQAMDELDNTYIIYTADHGMSIGRHGLMGKQNLYEHTWRVPFVAVGPGIPRGSRATGNILLLDLLATFCDLAEIKTPETNEGTSFRPVLEGKQESIRDVLYGAYCGGSKPGIRSVRQGDWKLIEYEAPDRGIRKTQLFDLKNNPQEWIVEHQSDQVKDLTGIDPEPNQTNLADHPQYAEKLKEMRALLLGEMRRLDDPFRFTNQPDDSLPPFPAPKKRERKATKEL